MKALIFAAGRGTRITKHIDGKPKCLVQVGKTTLIESTINKLRDRGIEDIAMVLGYKSEMIKEVVQKYGIEIYYNHFYDVTNSIASAWFAKDFLDENDEILFMNGDVFFDEALLNIVFEEKNNPVFFSDNNKKENLDYKFYCENGILKKYGKELTEDETTGEYIGMAKIGTPFIKIFKEKLTKKILKQEHSTWWENVIYEISEKYDIHVRDIEGIFWSEVDYIYDYERILNYIKYKNE